MCDSGEVIIPRHTGSILEQAEMSMNLQSSLQNANCFRDKTNRDSRYLQYVSFLGKILLLPFEFPISAWSQFGKRF